MTLRIYFPQGPCLWISLPDILADREMNSPVRLRRRSLSVGGEYICVHVR